MRLAQFTDSPTASWRYAERYLGGGTRTYSPFAGELEITARYHPQHGVASFTVPTFRVGAAPGNWLPGAIGSAVPPLYRDGDDMLLPVHPEALADPELPYRAALRRPGPPLEVVPSANARTVFVERMDGVPVPPHFVKLHYPKRLSRFTRRLRQPVIALQLWVAGELSRIGAPLLPEVAGGVVGDDPEQAWGFLIREAAVREPGGPPHTVPLFALYGRDVRVPGDPSLLEQLILHSGEDPGEWVATRLIEPVIALWCDVLLRTGCAIEPHGQNALFRFTGDGRTTGVAYRDCAVYVDPEIRSWRGLSGSLPPRNVISQDVRKPRAQVFSLVYDSFLGSHALSYVTRLVQERFGVDPEVLHQHARKVFAAQTGSLRLLPDTVYYYDGRLHPDGRWELVDTGRPPVWR